MGLKSSFTHRKSTRMIGVGIALGVALGVALDNLALGLGIGIVLGAVLSLRRNRKHGSDRDKDPGDDA